MIRSLSDGETDENGVTVIYCADDGGPGKAVSVHFHHNSNFLPLSHHYKPPYL